MNRTRIVNRTIMQFGAVVCWVLFMAGCAPRREMKVLIQMVRQQENYFKQEVVPGFQKKNRITIDVRHMNNIDSIEYEIDTLKGQLGLVKIPFGKSWSLVRSGRIRDLNSLIPAADLDTFHKTYLLTSLGQSGGKQYLIPRKFETRIMVYCKSKVADAIANWRTCRDSVNASLKAINGYGLPATYTLESNPDQWDYFDLYLVGWYWAHTSYEGKVSPRIANRGKRYSGTSLGVVDRVFQCNGDSTSVLTMGGDPVTDAFMWEAAYAAGSVYNKRMWEEGWSGAGIWQAFSTGDVFLSFMTQLDCFFIHGTGRDSLDGFLKDPDDMGVATMPAGCSIMLDKNGNALRPGRRSITTGGWWWGIPADAPYPQASYDLAMDITGTRNQIQECSRYGMIPVRKDILGDMSMMFGGGWITQVYETSFRQLTENGNVVVPINPAYDRISVVYLDAWYDIVVGRNWSPDKTLPSYNYIRSVLDETYVPKAKAFLRSQ